MRNSERLRALKAFLTEKLCQREMKAPADDYDLTKVIYQKPRVYLGWQPTRPDTSGYLPTDPVNVCPGILIMPRPAYAEMVEDQRFDQYRGVGRDDRMGSQLNVDILFSIYEPGIRLPGFKDNPDKDDGIDLKKIIEGTEEGLFSLLDWMDECVELLAGEHIIPGTDLALRHAELMSSLYSDQNYVVDKRPIFYGFVTAGFSGHTEQKTNDRIRELMG